MQKKKATGTKTADWSRSMKQSLDMGVEVCDNQSEEEPTPHNKQETKYV